MKNISGMFVNNKCLNIAIYFLYVGVPFWRGRKERTMNDKGASLVALSIGVVYKLLQLKN